MTRVYIGLTFASAVIAVGCGSVLAVVLIRRATDGAFP